MSNGTSCDWKDNVNKINKLSTSIEDCIKEKHSLAEEADELKKSAYTMLCEFLKLDLNHDEDPMEKIEYEKSILTDKVENLRTELAKVRETKEALRAKLCSKKRELAQNEALLDDPNLGTDVQSKNKFKFLSKFLNVSYKTDQDSQATAVLFKDCNRQIRFDDHNKSNQQKMSDFWRILEFIDRKET